MRSRGRPRSAPKSLACHVHAAPAQITKRATRVFQLGQLITCRRPSTRGPCRAPSSASRRSTAHATPPCSCPGPSPFWSAFTPDTWSKELLKEQFALGDKATVENLREELDADFIRDVTQNLNVAAARNASDESFVRYGRRRVQPPVRVLHTGGHGVAVSARDNLV